MKSAFLGLTFTAIFLLTSSCQVKESAGSSGLVSGHKPATNAFTLLNPSAKTFVSGETLRLGLKFPFPVTVDTTGGTPRLNLTIGTATRYADYVSGDGTTNLTFEYTIVAGDNDADGVAFNALEPNGATMTFDNKGTTTNCSTAIPAKTFTNLLVDNTAPYVVEAKFTNVPSYYQVGDAVHLTVEFNERVFVAGTPRLRMAINESNTGNVVYAEYISGSGTDTLTFTFDITEDSRHNTGNIGFDAAIDLNGGTIEDAVALAANLALGAEETDLENASALIRFNGTMPVLQNITVPTPGSYAAGATLDFVLEFDRPVSVTPGTGGTPSLPIKIGANGSEVITRQFLYNAVASTNTSLTFRYTLVPGDADTDGLQVLETGGDKILNMSGGASITAQSGGEAFVNTVNILGTDYHNHVLNIPDLSNIVLNSVLPVVQSVTIAPDTSGAWGVGTTGDGYFKIGEEIIITVNFNDNMEVNQTSGTPSLPLNIGGVTKNATYLSGGDGQTSLVFKYVVEEGLEDTDGIQLGAAIELNNGTITNAANTNAQLTLPSQTFTDRMVDAVRPTVTNVLPPTDGIYSGVATPVRNRLDFTVVWTEAVSVTNPVNLPIVIDVNSRNANYQSGNTTTNTVFRYTVQTTDPSDTNGIVMGSPLTLGTNGTIYDAHGNAPSDLSYVVPDTTGVLVDTVVPTIVSVTPPTAGRYTTGQDLDFIVEFSEDVDIAVGSEAPHLRLEIGRAYVSAGSGTDTYTFTYTVADDDEDQDLVNYVTKQIYLGTGSYIRDAGANALAPRTFTDNISDIEVDEVAPTISSAATTAGTYVSAADGNAVITINVTFSESTTIDTTGGTPEISLDLDTGTVAAEYDSAASTTTVKRFKYTIDDTADMDLDGLEESIGSIVANGATFKDHLGNDADLTLPSNTPTITNLGSVFVVPHAPVWIKGSTTNRSGFTTKPAVSTDAPVIGGYFRFDSTTLPLTFTPMPTITSFYMAFRTPFGAEVNGGQNFIENWATLDEGASGIDMGLANPSNVTTVSGYSGGGPNHNDAFAENFVELVKIVPNNPLMLSNTFIHQDFTGDVAEVLIFDSTLSAGQATEVMNYLDRNY